MSAATLSPVTLAISQLLAAPAKDATADAGHHFVAIHFNTNQKTQIKPASQYYQVPILRPVQSSGSVKTDKLIAKLIDDAQFEALKEYNAGELELNDTLCDLELLADYATTDGRGERDGLKQSKLIEWITGYFAKYLSDRIARNLASQTSEQRANMLASYMYAFKLAATRGNKRKEKSAKGGEVSVTLQRLNDLRQRMESYLTDSNVEHQLDDCEESQVLLARIKGHIAIIEASLADTDVQLANF